MLNYYDILEVREIALQSEIKSAYKRLAKKYHPDINPNPKSEEYFKLISTAYAILSDPVQRRRFDEQLSAHRATYRNRNPYNTVDGTIKSTQRGRRYRKTQYSPQRKQYQTTYSRKDDIKGTFYAFAFIAVVALLVLSSIAIYNYVERLQMENLVENFDNKAQQVDSLYYAGKIDEALRAVMTIKKFVKKESALRSYEFDYLTFRKEQADFDYENKAYKDALWGYLLYKEYTSTNDYAILTRMANCYRKTNKPYLAINIYDDLMEQNFKRIQMLNNIAETYRFDLNNPDLALQYYEIGVESIQKKFKKVYGDAFRLLVNKENTPYSYKQIYWSTAQLYMQKSYYKAAIKLLEWVIYLQPKNAAAYQLLHDAYFREGNTKQACNIFDKAKSRNLTLTPKLNCSQ